MIRTIVPLCLLSPLLHAEEALKPNVVLIVADDLGYGDISCNGQGKIRTPAIDRLAASGMRLTSGYVPASTCTPTRYSLMTGEYPWRKSGTGILPGDAALIISPSRVTLPRVFREAGYATGAVGKWHMGMGDGKLDFNGEIKPGLRELGFEWSFHMAATGDRVPCVFIENGRVVNLDPADPIRVSYGKKIGDWPTGKENPDQMRMLSTEGHQDTIINGIGRIGFMTGGKKALWSDQTMSDVFCEQAVSFMKRSKDKPFFLYYAAHEPHVPRDPNPRFVGKSGLGARADAILQLDDQVDRLMKALEDLGVAKRTLVILTSDNGPAVFDGYADGAKVTETKGKHSPSGNFRGGKYTDYEGGVRMPFVVSWPGKVTAGSKSDEMVSATDLVATAAALVNRPLAAVDAPDSRNLLPVLSGGKSPHEFLLYGNPNPKHQPSAIREGKWKLVIRPSHQDRNPPMNQATPDPKGAPQLFDLSVDPGESKNLAQEHPEVVKRLQDQAEAAAVAGFTRPGAAKVEVR